MQTLTKPSFESLSKNFHHWQKVGDLIDQCIDLMLNLRQSGHPGGSRSKVPLLVASTLGAGMRWDLRHPEAPFGDRCVLVVLVLLALVRPTLPRWVDRLNVIYLLDVSDSISLAARESAFRFAAQSGSGARTGDQSGVIVFGEEAVVDQPLKPGGKIERRTTGDR